MDDYGNIEQFIVLLYCQVLS